MLQERIHEPCNHVLQELFYKTCNSEKAYITGAFASCQYKGGGVGRVGEAVPEERRGGKRNAQQSNA